MKNTITILLILAALAVNAQKTTTKKELTLKNGIYCLNNSDQGYSGVLINYHPNGEIESKITVKNGKISGKITTYFISGKKRVLTYQDENFINYSKTIVWNENATIAFKGKWVDGKLYKTHEKLPFSGKITVKFKNDQVNEESDFKNGWWHGKQIIYDYEGNVVSECIFENNKIIDCPIPNKKVIQ